MSGTRRKPGRMGPYVEGYRVRLLELGYAPDTVRNELKVLGQLGRWMAKRHLGPEQLDGPVLTDFITMRRCERFRRVRTLRSFGKLLAYLDASGVSAARPRPPATELDVLLGEYEQWLVAKRALAPRTVLRYSALARKFLAVRVSAYDALGVTGLNGKVVARFLLDECARLSLGSAKGRVTELRSLLRFLHLKGPQSTVAWRLGPPCRGLA